MRENYDVVVITGPTATGKTALGASLAKRFGGEVVSADSMQVYKYMDIGTAKPSQEETLGVPHHMIGVVSPFEDFSAARYVKEAGECVEDIIAREKLPVIVGGTGLYIDSLLAGSVFAAASDPVLRAELNREYDEKGGAAMKDELSKFDADSFIKLHENDKKRIVRAFEVFRLTGETISEHDRKSKSVPPRYTALKIALTFSDRADLYKRIDSRVDNMLESGLEAEVRRLLNMGVQPGGTAMQAIGYKELVSAMLEGNGLTEAAEKIKMETRRYAKRQLSWLRRDTGVKWITWEKTPDLDFGLSISTGYLRKA